MISSAPSAGHVRPGHKKLVHPRTISQVTCGFWNASQSLLETRVLPAKLLYGQNILSSLTGWKPAVLFPAQQPNWT